MKATDLMIGDLVYCRIDKPAQVVGLTTDSIETTDKDGYFSEDYFEPISLTPEILKKNGFEQGFWSGHNCLDSHTCLNYNEYEDNKGDFDLYICNGIRKGSTCEEVNEFEFTAIRYVHQLQHALRLCGIEKEIQL